MQAAVFLCSNPPLFLLVCPLVVFFAEVVQVTILLQLESLRPTAADSRAVGPFYCFFVLFSILLDADASVSSGTHYLQLGYRGASASL